MNKQEFIKLAVSSGYRTKSAAEHYVEQHDKPEYTTDDFISLYHTSMHWNGVAADKGLLPAHGVNGRTTAFRNGVGGNSGTGCGQELSGPLGTITTKDRFGLVNAVTEINGEQYILKDIFLRMLKPEELKLMQGFPRDYIIDRDYNWKKYPVCEQVKRIGNSVVPIMAEALVKANCPYLKVGERQPAPMVYMHRNGQVAFG